MNMLKSACGVVSIIVGIGNASPALAATTGTQALGSSATVIDIWSVRCTSGTTSAAAHVEDLAAVNNPAGVRLALTKSAKLVGTHIQGGGADLTQDLTEGGLASPKAVLSGSRDFWMQFYKIRPKTLPTGREAYRGTVICNTPGGPVDPALKRTQNQ